MAPRFEFHIEIKQKSAEQGSAKLIPPAYGSLRPSIHPAWGEDSRTEIYTWPGLIGDLWSQDVLIYVPVFTPIPVSIPAYCRCILCINVYIYICIYIYIYTVYIYIYSIYIYIQYIYIPVSVYLCVYVYYTLYIYMCIYLSIYLSI